MMLKQVVTVSGDGSVTTEVVEMTPEETAALAEGAYTVPPARPSLDPFDFRRRFTMLERAKITAAAEQAMRGTPPDPTLRVILDDLGAAKTVYLDDPEVAQAIDVFILLGLVAPERKAEILAP